SDHRCRRLLEGQILVSEELAANDSRVQSKRPRLECRLNGTNPIGTGTRRCSPSARWFPTGVLRLSPSVPGPFLCRRTPHSCCRVPCSRDRYCRAAKI